MSLFTWKDSYSVKVAMCDAQHKRLFDIFNQLAEALRNGKGQHVMDKTVSDLVAYTRTHFQHEEALMQKAHYPQLAAHQAMHRRFVGDVQNLERDLREGRSANSIQLLNILRDWLLNHILKVDKSYSDDLNAAGIH